MDKKSFPKELYTSFSSPFTNTDAIFVEYSDLINSYMFTMLLALRENEEFNNLFDASEISELSLEDLYSWYLKRKDYNIFNCLPIKTDIVEKYKTVNEFTEEFLKFEVECMSSIFIDKRSETRFAESLKNVFSQTIIGQKYVYSDFYIKEIEDEIVSLYGENVKYVYGDLEQVLSDNKITSNTTFFFSDVNKIKILDSACILHFASIGVASCYDYNFDTTKEERELKLDIKSLLENNGYFKLSLFDPTK